MFFVAEKIKRIWLELINSIYGDLFFITVVYYNQQVHFLVAAADNKIYSGLVWFEHILLYIYSIQKVRTQVLITYVV